MKVRLQKPGKRVHNSALVVQTRPYNQLRFVNADTCQLVDVPSAAYRQSFSRWQKERGH